MARAVRVELTAKPDSGARLNEWWEEPPRNPVAALGDGPSLKAGPRR